ncbi:unnamed protein product [Durusdinium trenchii]|uniref:RNA helicase n=1 Tax=Durusdinium trenchii TaxID=1381693 RepID=A0ABP0N5P3_9DINO
MSKGRGQCAAKGKSYEKGRTSGKGPPLDDYFELKSSKVTLGEESRDEILALIAQFRQGPKPKKEVKSDGQGEKEDERGESSEEMEEDPLMSNREKRKQQIRLKKNLMKQLLEEDKREAGEEKGRKTTVNSKPDSSHVQVRVFYRDERKPSDKKKGPELIRRGAADAVKEFLELAKKKLQINGKKKLWAYKQGEMQTPLEKTADLADNSVLVISMREITSSDVPEEVTEKEPSASQGPETTGEKPLETAPSMPNLEAVRAAYAQRAVSAAPPLTKAERQSISEELLKSWEAYEERGDLLRSRSNLPAAEVRAPFLEALAAHQVVVVAGETGSGKTTQCPNFILEAASATGRGGDVSIICTQPRRIAAVGVATRVAEERGETVGGHVGYAVRLDSRSTRYTRLLFCTTGVLLNRLNASPDLEGVTHIVLDEVHERSLHTDFLLTILRELLYRRPDLKLVLMSATMQQSIFSDYFGGLVDGDEPRVPVINVCGRTYPVTVRYEGQAQAASKGSPIGPVRAETVDVEDAEFEAEVKRQYGRGAKEIRISPAVQSSADLRQIANLCAAILTGKYEPDEDGQEERGGAGGAILVFLPGHAEIENCISQLKGQRGDRAWILPLHGSMSVQQQQRVFKRPPAGQRKIIVSTNIAETSITIDDVTHVIDSCHVKETRFSPQSSTSVFSTVWVSQAAAKQRAGRAGRTRPGVCWRLCRQDFMEKELPKHTLCEMQRTPLEELVLQLRLLELGDHPGDFLRRAPEPPALEAVERAIRALVAIGALENDSQLRLTPLGFHLAHMPVDARIGKMLVYGSLCKCLAPILTIAACLSQRSPFIRNFNRTKEELQVQERRNVWGELHSDQLAAAKAYDKYHEQRRQGRENAWAVCDRFGLSSSTLDDVAQLRQQFLRHLAETGFADAEAGEDGGDQVNVHQSNLSLVRCVMCAGLFPNVAQVQRQSNARGTYHIFVSRQRERCAPHPSSLNFRQGNEFAANHGWLLFHDKVKTSQVYLHDTTLIGSLPILLFGGDLKILAKERKCVTVDGMIFEAKDEKAAVLFKELRRELDRLLLLKVANPAEDLSTSAEPLLLTVCGYDQLLCDAAGDHTEPWCALKEMGCPVHCADVDFQCHTPASCTGCTAVNWCSSAPCPASCKDHEISCSGASGSYCVPFDTGCPAKCHKDEYECHRPGVSAGEAGVNYCSSAPCPPGCNETEVACGTNDGVEFCAPKELGCPVNCTKSMNACHAPPKCDNCTGLNWCSAAPCPELCGHKEVSCSRLNGSNFCVNRSEGCPVHCHEKEESCHWPPLEPHYQGMNWCSNEPCPTVCNDTQLACMKEDGSGTCAEREDGCPVKCHDDEFACHLPPQHEACVQWAYCHHIKAPDLAKGWFPVYDIERL